MASKIPATYSGLTIQPHEYVKYKTRNVPESHKIYFCGWRFYANSEKNARNFKKSEEWLGNETCAFCMKNNISSCWTDNINGRKDFSSPQTYFNANKCKP